MMEEHARAQDAERQKDHEKWQSSVKYQYDLEIQLKVSQLLTKGHPRMISCDNFFSLNKNGCNLTLNFVHMMSLM